MKEFYGSPHVQIKIWHQVGVMKLLLSSHFEIFLTEVAYIQQNLYPCIASINIFNLPMQSALDEHTEGYQDLGIPSCPL